MGDDLSYGDCRGCVLKVVGGVIVVALGFFGTAAVLVAHPWSPSAAAAPAPSAEFLQEATWRAAAVERGECNFDYPQGTADCMCQISGNAQCTSLGECTCPQGCDRTQVWTSDLGVTFKSHLHAGLCSDTRVLTTIPKDYFSDIEFLRDWCPRGARKLVKDLLEAGFEQYQAHVAHGPVKQCVHTGAMAEERWLHIFTLCSDGSIRDLQDTSDGGWCAVSETFTDIERNVDHLMQWSMHDKTTATGSRRFDSCQDMGCGVDVPGPLCQCTEECLKGNEVTCCGDYDTCVAVEEVTT